MPLSMKIQPIDVSSDDHLRSEMVTKPVVKSRLKRLFRISVAEQPNSNSGEHLEPSSVCLAKMVQNFIEETNEKPLVATKNRCNCFNGDSSDGESDTGVCDFLKSLVVGGSVNERKVLKETMKIVAEKSKVCKNKDELRKIVTEGLLFLGYDAAICKSKWDKSLSFPAGEYEYVDVIIGGERLIIDIDLRSEFEVARSTKTYKSILQILPHIFVGKSDRLSKIICILSEAAKQSLKKKGMHIPPWRKVDYVQAKWLSPPTRLVSSTCATPPPSPLAPAASLSGPDEPTTEDAVSPLDGSGSSPSSPGSEPLFDMSESSGEEEVKSKVVKVKKAP